MSTPSEAPLTIRPLAASDREDWNRLWTEYLAFYETTLPQNVYNTAFERMLSDGPGEFQGLIAEQNGKPVGLAHFLFHRALWSIEDTCYLMDLFVDPAGRGSGVGHALIEAVHAAAKKNGIPVTYWQTEENNYKGRMLYDKVARHTRLIIYEKED